MSSPSLRSRRAGILPIDGEELEMQVEQLACSTPFAMTRSRFVALQGGALARANVTPAPHRSREFGAIGSVRQGIVTIPVSGLLVPHENWMTQFFDATAYETVLQDATRAMADPTVRGVVLSFDSDGGVLTGAWETAQQLRAMRGQKPVRAHVQSACCGAAYWLAAACEQIVVANTAMLGDLGIQTWYWDESAALEEAGVREIIVTSSQTPAKNAAPTDPKGLAQWQLLVDDLAGVMLESVASLRNTTVAALTKTGGNGAVLVGARAVANGLAEALGSAESVHQSLMATLNSGVQPKARAAPAAAVQRTAESSNAGVEVLLAAMRMVNPKALISKRR